ncbi:MAG: hypothetical protein EOP12_03160 [Pseudomonas sp.]|nr:MAG: hypothetical protein EOP12_03160 [Pseudomonas sp.]
MNKHLKRFNIFERAVIEKMWHQTIVDAQIHALYGDNPQSLVDAAGRVLYVILEAVSIDNYDLKQDDFQSMREAITSMYDQVDGSEICERHRSRIIDGLETAEQLVALIQRSSIIQSACNLKEKLHKEHIHLNDFDALIKSIESQNCCLLLKN